MKPPSVCWIDLYAGCADDEWGYDQRRPLINSLQYNYTSAAGCLYTVHLTYFCIVQNLQLYVHLKSHNTRSLFPSYHLQTPLNDKCMSACFHSPCSVLINTSSIYGRQLGSKFCILVMFKKYSLMAVFSDGGTCQWLDYSKARINCRCMIRFIRSQPRASNCKIQKTLIQNIITLDKNYQWPNHHHHRLITNSP